MSETWDAEIPDKKVRRIKREQVFLTELGKSWRESDGFFYKIPDMPHVPGLRFDTEKPFDVFATWKHRRFAIEAKSLSRYSAFGIRHIRYSQEVGLNSFSESGGESWVFVSIADRMIPIEWLWLQKVFKVHGSIKKDELEAMSFIQRVKGRYDLKQWLNKN